MTISITRRAIATLAVLAAAISVALVGLAGHRPVARAATGGADTVSTVSCTGQVSGVLTPGTVHNVQNTVALQDSAHKLTRPFDSSTGQASGALQHSPFQFSLAANAPSDVNVRLLTALVNNETLKTCTFRYYDLDRAGRVQNYLRVVLTNGILVTHSFNPGSPGTTAWTMTYQKITWNGLSRTATSNWVSG